MNKHEFERSFQAWSQEEASGPASSSLRARVRDVPFQVPQQRTWLLRSTGRLQSMFSATKLVVAGAIVMSSAGFLLAGVLTTQEDDGMAPAAVTGSASPEQTQLEAMSTKPTDFSGTLPYLVTKAAGGSAIGPDAFVVTGETIEGVFSDLDDPRLNGTVQYVVNRIEHHGAGDLATYVARIDNDDGSWLGTGHGYHDASNAAFLGQVGKPIVGLFDTTIYRGTGAYAGLSAIMVSLPTDDETRVYGVVFAGEIPELPEMPGTLE